MKTFKSILILVLFPILCYAGYYGGKLIPHGHSSQADGGIITSFPNNSLVIAYSTWSWTVNTGTTSTPFNCGNEAIDRLGEFTDNTFTPSKAGYYHFDTETECVGNVGDGGTRDISVVKQPGSVSISYTKVSRSQDANVFPHTSGLVYLSVGDSLRFYVHATAVTTGGMGCITNSSRSFITINRAL